MDMLHSFSVQVYSFQQRRQIPRQNKSNICTFFVRISAICIFLFAQCFAIIIVYNGARAEPPFKMMFSILGGEQKWARQFLVVISWKMCIRDRPITIIRAVRWLPIVFNKCCITKVVQRLFAKRFAGIFRIVHMIGLSYKAHHVMYADPVIFYSRPAFLFMQAR